MFTVSAMVCSSGWHPTTSAAGCRVLLGRFLIGNITGPLIGSALVGFGLRMPFVVRGRADRRVRW